jgi:hypothetical protein
MQERFIFNRIEPEILTPWHANSLKLFRSLPKKSISRKGAKAAKVQSNKIPAGRSQLVTNLSTEKILQTEIWEGRLDVKAGEPGNELISPCPALADFNGERPEPQLGF